MNRESARVDLQKPPCHMNSKAKTLAARETFLLMFQSQGKNVFCKTQKIYSMGSAKHALFAPGKGTAGL